MQCRETEGHESLLLFIFISMKFGFLLFFFWKFTKPSFCLFLVAYIGCFMRQSGWSENHHHTGCNFKNVEARIDIVGGSHDL